MCSFIFLVSGKEAVTGFEISQFLLIKAKLAYSRLSLEKLAGDERVKRYLHFLFCVLLRFKVNHFPTTNQSRIPSLPFVDFDTLKIIQDP